MSLTKDTANKHIFNPCDLNFEYDRQQYTK